MTTYATIHPQVKSIGTVTTRPASGEQDNTGRKFNLLNQVKTPGYLECYVPRDGHVLVHRDYAALEPSIMAEFSRDPTYMKLYGPDANPDHDVYLFIGCHLSMFKDKFAEYYDIDNPTHEGKDKCKKIYKADRYACKKFHLSGMYKAGWRTQFINLRMAGYKCNEKEIEQANGEYWDDIFPGVLDFEDKLRAIRNRLGGWIITARGLPTAVADHKEKDLLNQFCQHSGHTLLQRDIHFIRKLRKKHKLPMYPWIPDYYDEGIYEVEISAAEEACHIMDLSLNSVNEELGWDVMIKGEPGISYNLAAIKCDDYEYPQAVKQKYGLE